jgi:hypothetical protein
LKLAGLDQAANWSKRESRHSIATAGVRRLREMGEFAGGLEYPAVHAAIARFQKRLKIDRELQQKLKKVAKTLRIEI